MAVDDIVSAESTYRMSYVTEPILVGKKVNFLPNLVVFSSHVTYNSLAPTNPLLFNQIWMISNI